MCCIHKSRYVLLVSTAVCSTPRETCNVISFTPCCRTVAILDGSYVRYIFALVGKLYENLNIPMKLNHQRKLYRLNVYVYVVSTC